MHGDGGDRHGDGVAHGDSDGAGAGDGDVVPQVVVGQRHVCGDICTCMYECMDDCMDVIV